MNTLNTLLLKASTYEIYWGGNTFTAKLIILAILGLLAFSVVMFVRDRRIIRKELLGLGQLQDNLNYWHSQIENLGDVYDEGIDEGQLIISNDTDDDLINVYEASIERDLLPHIPSGTIVHERLRVLDRLRNTKSRVNVGVLQQLSEVQYSQNLSSRFLPYAMSLAMLLGMFGTFIGLSVMVGEITEQLDMVGKIGASSSGNSDALYSSLSEIQNVMTGVRTAFTTTLAGLFCTIIVSVLGFLQHSRQLAFLTVLSNLRSKSYCP